MNQLSRYHIAYCGPAPDPADLLARWNADPLLLAGLAASAAAWMLFRKGTRRKARSFCAGIAVLLVIFVSPLCALTSALFAARAVHHLLLVGLAAPLLALAGVGPRRVPLGAAAAVHALVFWAWHAPGLYAWALASASGYWLMQASLLGSALVFWRATLRPDMQGLAGAAVMIAFAAQMGFLSALLTFAPAPLYGPHLLTTQAFGLGPLEDQQLAGLIMWTLGMAPYLAAALWLALSGNPRDRAEAAMR